MISICELSVGLLTAKSERLSLVTVDEEDAALWWTRGVDLERIPIADVSESATGARQS